MMRADDLPHNYCSSYYCSALRSGLVWRGFWLILMSFDGDNTSWSSAHSTNLHPRTEKDVMVEVEDGGCCGVYGTRSIERCVDGTDRSRDVWMVPDRSRDVWMVPIDREMCGWTIDRILQMQ